MAKNSLLILYVILLQVSLMSCCAAELGLDTFQKFVNGQIPIKEATMSRKLFKADGKLMNEEWWRFAYQDGTWFVQRLMPGTNDASKLVPTTDHHICGASFSDVWVVSDENLHWVRKDMAAGSVPDEYGEFSRGLLNGALSLGLPRQTEIQTIQDSVIQWDGLKFTAIVNNYSTNGHITGTSPVTGMLILGSNGLPASCELPAMGISPAATLTYEYAPNTKGIPKIFARKSPGGTLCFEFLSLQLGSNDLSSTGGYVPSQFSETNYERHTTVWLKKKSYFLKKGILESSSELPPTPKLGDPSPPLHAQGWLNTTNSLALADLRGKVVLLDVWAMWCPSCVEALPDTQAISEKYKDQGLAVIGVNMDEKNGKLETFLKKHKVTFPIMVDEVEKPNDTEYEALPTLFVKDHKPIYPVQEETFVTCASFGSEGGIPKYILINKSGNLAWISTNGERPTDTQIQQLLKSSD
jgi:thiol-disulfide isomerase/thioredoxin